MAIQRSKGYSMFKAFNFIFMLIVVFVTLFPFLYMFAMSFSSNTAILQGKVFFLPVEFTIKPYLRILEQKDFWTGYRNTVLYTVTGTAVGLFMTTICAYPLSKKRLLGRGLLLKLIVFTMYFGGGLIPTYLLVNSLHMTDKIWALIIPGAISPYNMLIMKTFFEGIPQSLEEAAAIDGLNELGILIKIVMPLSKPILATISLFVAVWFWNDWFYPLIYINNNIRYPVTLFLRNVIMGSQMAAKNGQVMDSGASVVMPQSLQAATVMLVTIPILLVYPFIQKYFVQGMMIGSIKE
ncbi:carbohydrate ABC transporter permease [Ruminiclostridium cellobioparum]|uniref:ABC-type sugar transport system, permease component n=1 Tax=Ruminiclostridium cellobioparum subsp. termitidis CT1112 TaxID=1195236 RepID=S0FFQ7_RUMCE|nr:carbohydrate ABC transporter permease [Ruminiclostridium cellobioparum]EMS69482.1 ABC-type sugar transport system, permease component [Ruminiclostridium cellobioparum subsp. termitidis CT1112]